MAVFAANRQNRDPRPTRRARQKAAENAVRISEGSREAAERGREYARRHPLVTAGLVTGAAVAATTAGYAWYRRRNGNGA